MGLKPWVACRFSCKFYCRFSLVQSQSPQSLPLPPAAVQPPLPVLPVLELLAPPGRWNWDAGPKLRGYLSDAKYADVNIHI